MIIRTIILEDWEIDKEGIQSLFGKIPNIKIVATFQTPKEALNACLNLHPELVIVDAEIGTDKSVGPQFVKNLKMRIPEVKILGLTKWGDCYLPLKNAGCNFVLLKQFFEEKNAEIYIRETLFDDWFPDMKFKPPQLTKIEDEVLRMTVGGLTENEVGEKLNSTRKQVRRIKESLFNKFGANNVAQLVALAYQSGYLNPGEPI